MKAKFERNYRKEGTFSREEKGTEWYTFSSNFYGLHVFGKDDKWSYKINALGTQRQSKPNFTSKESAMKMCVEVVNKLLTDQIPDDFEVG